MSSSAARATIEMSARSSRAVSVMKTLSASESAHAMIDRARAIPASRSTASSLRVALDEVSPRLGRARFSGSLVDAPRTPARAARRSRTTWRPTRPKPQTMWWSVSESIIFCVRRAAQQLAEMAVDEQLGDEGERVEERTHAEHDQSDLRDLPGRTVRLGEAADRRVRVERPAERVPVVVMLAAREDERRQQQQDDRDRGEDPDAARDMRQAPERELARTLAHRPAVLVAAHEAG